MSYDGNEIRTKIQWESTRFIVCKRNEKITKASPYTTWFTEKSRVNEELWKKIVWNQLMLFFSTHTLTENCYVQVKLVRKAQWVSDNVCILIIFELTYPLVRMICCAGWNGFYFEEFFGWFCQVLATFFVFLGILVQFFNSYFENLPFIHHKIFVTYATSSNFFTTVYIILNLHSHIQS